MYQVPLPEKFQKIEREEALALIAELKGQLAERMVILGHHYQHDDIIGFADFTGDSLKLSQIAAEQRGKEFIVFCGVHFMAESADILTGPGQKVLLPDMTAGCPMADMAEIDQVEECWQVLEEKMVGAAKIVPVTYVNSAANIKAFCGEHGGMCCTSSNCEAIFESIWSADAEAVILFLPDQHLGRNTAFAMGHAIETMPVWNPFEAEGGIEPGQYERARVILWDGFCSVHQEFKLEQIVKARTEDPAVKVIVHPECCFEVAQNADYVGSTELIIKTVSAAEPRSSWVVGTEIHLVKRLANRLAGKNIKVSSLSDSPCMCETMYRIDLGHLAWLLEKLKGHCDNPEENPLPNQVKVDEETAGNARQALDRMLKITAAKNYGVR